MPFLMMMSREVRRVPMDYEPPRNSRGDWQPRFEEFYVPAVKRWLAEREAWESGADPDRERYPDTPFEEWHGNGPDPDYYYPGDSWPEGTEMGIQMYETVSEGTPLSRVYPDTPEGRQAMAEELTTVDSGISSDLTAEQWLQIIDGTPLARDIYTGEVA